MVFGVGVDEDETIPHHIEELSGVRTINMGIGGSSNFHTWYNLLQLISAGTKPKAIINVYTTLDRLMYFNESTVNKLGAWTLIDDKDENEKRLYQSWNFKDTNIVGYGKLLQQTIQTLCKGIPYVECSYFEHSANSLSVPKLTTIDLARDMKHPGSESHKKSALTIIDLLNA